MGLQSGDLAGHSIRSMPFPSRSIDRPTIQYVDEELEPHVVPYAAAIGDEFVFMDDNARPHRARVADQLLEENGIERMELPARSPDWDNIKRKANKKVKDDTTLEEFQRILQRAWANLDQRRIQTLINSMLKRCREVIEADGGPINWTLHSLWCLLKVKHRVTCNKWCLKVQKHAWFSCYSCRSWHKSQKCKIVFHTFCHKMHDFIPMPSIGRHIPFIFA